VTDYQLVRNLLTRTGISFTEIGRGSCRFLTTKEGVVFRITLDERLVEIYPLTGINISN